MRAAVTLAQMEAMSKFYSKFIVKSFGFTINHLIPLQYQIQSGTNLQLSTTPTTLPYCWCMEDIANILPPYAAGPHACHGRVFRVGYDETRIENTLPEYEFLDDSLPFQSGVHGALNVKKNIVNNILSLPGFKTFRSGETWSVHTQNAYSKSSRLVVF